MASVQGVTGLFISITGKQPAMRVVERRVAQTAGVLGNVKPNTRPMVKNLANKVLRRGTQA